MATPSSCLLYTLLLVSSVLSQTVSLPTFELQDNYVGASFLSGFVWETMADPSGGRVNYVDQPTAIGANLTYTSSDKFVMRGDSTNIVQPGAAGRNSVRITSVNSYTDSIMVLDIQHMPIGCATWPAFWTLTNSGGWPQGGEVDIIEGINNNQNNLASLHTGPGCSMPATRSQTGAVDTVDCDIAADHDAGCGVTFSKKGNFGAALNSVGGGWYVIVRTDAGGMAMYFWARNDKRVPAAVRAGASSLHPDSSWGRPEASFPTTDCNFPQFFDAHQIIINLTFCGSWAGPKFISAGCGPDCNDFVDNNPQAFTEAYWELNALRVYVPQTS